MCPLGLPGIAHTTMGMLWVDTTPVAIYTTGIYLRVCGSTTPCSRYGFHPIEGMCCDILHTPTLSMLWWCIAYPLISLW